MDADPPAVVKPPEPESARAVFLAWEKLRVLYNGLLIAEVVAFATLGLTHTPEWPRPIGSAIGANVCFCAGPVGEGYLVVLGVPRPLARALTFALGCLVALALTPLAVTHRVAGAW